MFALPFVTIPKDILIPHPGNNYTITLSKTGEELLKTEEFKYVKDSITIIYKKAFVIAIANDEDDFSTIAVLCTLLNKAFTEDSYVYHFSSLKKIKLLGDQQGKLNFDFCPSLTIPGKNKNYDALISFIEANAYLKHIADNVNLNSTDKNETLDQIINYLYPNLSQDYEFFLSKNLKQKIDIINSLVITYHCDFKKSQPLLYPDNVLQKINKETSRLNNLPQSSAEYSNTLDYLEVIKSLPWLDAKQSNIDILKIESNLSSTHLGLEDIKEAVIDHFAFQQLTQMSSGTYMLFDGPPGTGKTSIAKTIAKATGRDFISIALGGISDEAEIRGHRRTYLGSKPGRLISGMQNLTSNNPVILLDEIDKISISNKGDPYSALLELLDPEQNSNFVDKYLEVPYDFSKAFIICTSNNIKNIPEPLKDRLSTVNFTQYTKEEKYIILTKYILPNFLEKYSLETYDINFSEDLYILISERNNLRQIKRVIMRLLKFAAKQILTGTTSIYLQEENYYDFYKKEKNKRRIGF